MRRPGFDVMRNVFERINLSPFLRGEGPGEWKATFDWALKPANIVKVLDGNYDDSCTGDRRTTLAADGASACGFSNESCGRTAWE